MSLKMEIMAKNPKLIGKIEVNEVNIRSFHILPTLMKNLGRNWVLTFV